ncbi:ABC transporter substrate-binding protein [Maritimibacter alexandrii]|uniref:ABC transporter substrate-binding protein n=1 Tax=Maritimibacter alexandrii TaxID=2570355 RepID=UPI001108040D|nr:ABC transporter substrate-binding protein [Maritimibacter alexandrii]
MKRRNLFGALGGALLGATLFAGSATAFQPPTKELEQVHVGVLLNGTASWEMQVIKDMGLDEENGFELVLKDVSGKQASHVALMSGDVDIVLSDFVWVASLRASGEKFTAVPHSYAVGGLMVSPDGPIASITDLPGKTIGIAGGPVDKSWVILQAYYMAETGETLADKVTARFGAPPLINELLTEGQIDASLNFWHFNARAKAGGAEELISVDTMMTETGIENRPPLLAWVFRDETAAKKRRAIKAFLDASFAAKAILLEDDEVWEGLREKMRARDDDALFTALRDDYRAGILRSYDDETIAAAAASFAIMAEHGGPDLVGESTEMDPGTFWSGYSH